MEEKVVLMVLKVDLECDRCCKKVKKVLAKFPQIRDQVYNEKQGIVLIKVVCCKPEKIMKKICSKGEGSITSIEIKEQKKEEKKEVKKEEKKEVKKEEKEEKKQEKKEEKKDEKKEREKPKVVAQSAQGYPPPPPYLVYSSSYYEGRPSYQYHGYGIPAAPPCYVGTPIYDSYGGREYYPGHSSHNYNPENPTGCSVM